MAKVKSNFRDYQIKLRNYNHLHYFYAVAKYGGVNTAKLQLNVAAQYMSAMSQ